MTDPTVSQSTDKVERLPVALLWLRIAAGILDGLPAPAGFDIINDHLAAIGLSNVTAASQWARHLQPATGFDLYHDEALRFNEQVKYEGWTVIVAGKNPAPEPLVLSEADEAIASDIRAAVKP